ncbi:hypothetical protein JNW90_35010 [Micromonospora sp. STR1s_5]|nr:hypothetical protein [Micromonospora sp. STR1s_5]
MVRNLGLCLAALLLGSCQMGPAAPVTAAFDAKSAEYVLKTGKGRIEGQAFLRRDQGRLVTAAGERVFLIPATAYAVERFDRMFGGDRRSYYGNAVDDPPPEYLALRRETKVDMTGRFTFENLARGRYIVATRVFWTEPKSFFTHGGAMYDVVDVKDDETTTAIISGK